MRSLALLALLTSTHAHAESTRYENVRVRGREQRGDREPPHQNRS